MARHSPAVAELDRLEAERLRARAVELAAQIDTYLHPGSPALADAEPFEIWRWAGAASVILEELGRG